MLLEDFRPFTLLAHEFAFAWQNSPEEFKLQSW